MIDPQAVQRHFARMWDDHLWMKTLTDKELDAELAALNPPPRFRVPLWRHQKVGFLLGVAYPHFSYHLDMGTGKTGLALSLLDYWFFIGLIRKGIIQTPTDEVSDGWEEEMERITPSMPRVLLKGATDNKIAELAAFKQGAIVGTYAGMAWLMSERHRHKNKKKDELVMVPKLVDAVFDGVGALVNDESTKVGNHDSLYFKIANRAADKVPILYNLTGRPYGRDPSMAWSQFYLLDRGETLGPTLGLFRERFFKKRKAHFHRGHDFKFDKTRLPELQRVMGHSSLRYDADECLDMPAELPIIKRLRFDEEAATYYANVKKEVADAKGNYRVLKSAFIRMRQIASGFVGMRDDETGDKIEIEFPDNPKLDYLMQWLKEIPEGRKALIFHDYTHTGRMIGRELTAAKVRHNWLWGGMKETWQDIKREFDKADSGLDVLVINSRKGALGLNLQAANYTYVFENPVSCIEHDQMKRRTRRGGQKRRCFYLYPVIRGTADERILEFHKEGKELWDNLSSKTLL